MNIYRQKSKLSLSDCVLLAVIVAIITATYSNVSAQTRISPALALARVCVSEGGWECFTTGDGFAIHEVFLRGTARHRMSYVGFARAYSGATLGARAYPLAARRQWPAELNEQGTQPEHWPVAPQLVGHRGGPVRLVPATPWARYAARWRAVLAQARGVVRLTLQDVRNWSPCAATVDDWGGDMDHQRAVRLGLIPVACGGTENDFYRRPSQP